MLSDGIADTADLQFGMPWIASGAKGNGDASLDLKWRFYEKDAL